MRRVIIIAMVVLSTFYGLMAQEIPELLIGDFAKEMTVDTTGNPDFFRNALRIRETDINPLFQEKGNLLLEGAEFHLNLFDDHKLTAVIQSTSTNINGSFSIVARIEEHLFGFVIITTTNNRTLAVIEIPEVERKYNIKNTPGSEKYFIIEIDSQKFSEENIYLQYKKQEPIIFQNIEESDTNFHERIEKASQKDIKNTAIIDIMIVYSKDAKETSDLNHGGIENVIKAAMDRSQLTLNNSRTNIILNLVHSAQVDYVESGDFNTDLNRMVFTKPPNDHMNVIHEWRDQVGADLVALLLNTGGAGIAVPLQEDEPIKDGASIPKKLFRNSLAAFSITQVKGAYNGFTFIHELGHNLGAGHHKDQQDVLINGQLVYQGQHGPQLFDYSSGWRWQGSDGVYYCDVMTYEPGIYYADQRIHKRVPYFSNPLVNFISQDNVNLGATGYYVPNDPDNADNSKTVINTKHFISAYRNPPNRFYVNDSGDDNNTGGSWSNALKTLQKAIDKAQNRLNNGETIQIWVQKGTYYPTKYHTITLNERRKHLRLHNNIEIYGGFSGHETSLDQRDILINPTIISGDINQSGSPSGNVYHVFYHPSSLNLDETAVLDGFIISDGYADGDMAIGFSYNSDFAKGAGMKNEPGNNPTLRNVQFVNNQALEYGGAIYNDNSSPKLINVEVFNNLAASGGGLFNDNSSHPSVINSTFSGNAVTNYGGGIYNQNSTLSMINSIVWDNTAPNEPQISDYNSTSKISYSIIDGGYAGEGNLDINPGFMNSVSGDFDIDENSPCLEAGTNSPFHQNGPALGIDIDITGKPRIRGLTVDIGARENQKEQDIPFTATMTSVDSRRHPWVYTSIVVDVNQTKLGYMDKSNFEINENGIVQTQFEVVPPSQGGGVRRADIVFIMDNSGSMKPYQNSVAANVEDFVNKLSESGVDFALGLTRYGQSSNSGYPIAEENGQLTRDAEYFLNNVWTRNVDNGSIEVGYSAIVQTSNGFSFRPGAQKIFIIITDETPNQGGATLNDALNACTDNSITLYAITKESLFNTFQPITDAINGGLYDFYADYSGILNAISESVGFSYTVYYKAIDGSIGSEKNVEVKVSYGGNHDVASGKYISKSYQDIQISAETINYHVESIEAGKDFKIAAEITDYVEPYTQNATLFYKNTEANEYKSLSMISNNKSITKIWEITIPGNQIGSQGLDYYITASDGTLTSSFPAIEANNHPLQIAVLPNVAPQIRHKPVEYLNPGNPLRIAAEIYDETDFLEAVNLFYRKSGQLIFQQAPMTTHDDTLYTSIIPGDMVSDWGVEYYIEANDNSLIKGYMVNDSVLINSDNPLFVHQIGCEIPPGLLVQNLSGNSVNLSWAAGSGFTWDIIWGPYGFNPDQNGNLVENIGENSYVLSGLEQASEYSFSVRQNCGGIKSAWSWPYKFTTLSINHNITATSTSNGVIIPEGIVNVDHQNNQNFTIAADTCYHISKLTVDGQEVSEATGTFHFNYEFPGVEQDHEINVEFTLSSYRLTYTAGLNGTMSGQGIQDVDCNNTGTPVEAMPNNGYRFVQWSDGSTMNPRTDTNVTSDISVTAVFEIALFDISAVADPPEGGTISGGGSFLAGSNINLVAVPSSGFHFFRWTEDDNRVFDHAMYNFNVDKNRQLTGHFVDRDYILLSNYKSESFYWSDFEEVSINADMPWLAIPSNNWITVYPNYGPKGESTVMISWLDNTSAIHREGKVVFQNDMATSEYDIIQYGTSLSSGNRVNENLMIYPNPAHDRLFIKGLPAGSSFCFTNIHGSIVLCEDQTREEMSVSLSGLSPGFYNLIIITPQGKLIRKVVVY